MSEVELQLCLAGGTAVSTHPLVGEVRLSEELQSSCFRDNSNRETEQGCYPMLRYRGRKRVTQRNSVEGNRQRENEIVQGALQGEHREEIVPPLCSLESSENRKQKYKQIHLITDHNKSCKKKNTYTEC